MNNHGIGLRAGHATELLERGCPTGWAEAITENFLGRGGRPFALLERVRETAEVILHGVSLSIGGLDPFDPAYLAALKALHKRVQPAWVSDHLCPGSVGGHMAHDLWPLPYTEECLAHLCRRVDEVQCAFGAPLVLENVSSYVAWRSSEMAEWEFLSELVRRSGCRLLLDINNVYVSARNHGFAPGDFLEGIPRSAVVQYHLAGHEDRGAYLLDSHEGAVSEPVWDLYRAALRRFGSHPTIVEWDGKVPPLEDVLRESQKAAEVEADVLCATRAAEAHP